MRYKCDIIQDHKNNTMYINIKNIIYINFSKAHTQLSHLNETRRKYRFMIMYNCINKTYLQHLNPPPFPDICPPYNCPPTFATSTFGMVHVALLLIPKY